MNREEAMDAREWQARQQEIRDNFVAHLIERVSKDRYPSTTMLDLIEQSMGPEHVDDYAQALIDKIEQDEFPSFALMDRVRSLL
jgi:hypothetical protein